MKKLILISTLFITPLVFSQDYVYNGINEVNAQIGLKNNNNNSIDTIKKWTFINKNIKGLYIKYSDIASGAYGTFDVNLGQRPFLGDSKGYEPFDKNYDKNLWKNATNINNNVYKTSENLRSAYYNKTYNNGQYYFEVTIGASPVYDALGFGTTSNLRLGRNSIDEFGISAIGTHDHRTLKTENGILESGTYSGEKILSGDTIQVWIDFDKGNVLFKEYGVPLENYNIIEIE